MGTLKNHDLTNETVDSFKECFDLNGSPKNTERIFWQFFDNTEKRSFVKIAVDEEANNRTAAIYAISCVRFQINNQSVLASQSLDTITDVNYRGKGLFIQLATEVYDDAEKSEVKLVYGFPNGNSIHGFEKKLDWKVLDPLPFLIKPLKTKYFTSKIGFLKFLPNFNLSLSEHKIDKAHTIKLDKKFPTEVNEVWKNFSSHFKVSILRDDNYLNWRYIQKPNETYEIAHCYNSKNMYLGYVVYVVKEKHEGKIGYIMELIYNVEEPKAAESLLGFAINNIKKQDADCILSWCLEHSPNYKTFKRKRFYTFPKKLRPIELHFGTRCFGSQDKELISNRENWYISYSDSDTV